VSSGTSPKLGRRRPADSASDEPNRTTKQAATDNQVRAGQRMALPGRGWEVVAGGPPGTETLLVMVTDAPRDLGALAQEKTGPFVKTLLDGDGRARLQWILSNGTPAPNCGKAGAASCSDAFGAALLKVETVR
jgi:hypothetical protein